MGCCKHFIIIIDFYQNVGIFEQSLFYLIMHTLLNLYQKVKLVYFLPNKSSLSVYLVFQNRTCLVGRLLKIQTITNKYQRMEIR